MLATMGETMKPDSVSIRISPDYSNYEEYFESIDNVKYVDGDYIFSKVISYKNYTLIFQWNENLSFEQMVIANRNGVRYFEAKCKEDCLTDRGEQFQAAQIWIEMEKDYFSNLGAMLEANPEWNSIKDYPRFRKYVDSVNAELEAEKEREQEIEIQNLNYLKNLQTDMRKCRKIGLGFSISGLAINILGLLFEVFYITGGILWESGETGGLVSFFVSSKKFFESFSSITYDSWIPIILLIYIPLSLVFMHIGYKCNSTRNIEADETGLFRHMKKEDTFSTKLWVSYIDIAAGFLVTFLVFSVVGVIFVICFVKLAAVSTGKVRFVDRDYYYFL